MICSRFCGQRRFPGIFLRFGFFYLYGYWRTRLSLDFGDYLCQLGGLVFPSGFLCLIKDYRKKKYCLMCIDYSSPILIVCAAYNFSQ
jgi:hypothetical protein